MSDLEKYIKECNLIFTNTLTMSDFCLVNFPGIENVKVNSEDCLTLFDLVSSFNKLYIRFKKECDKLEKLNLAEKMHVYKFGKFNVDDKDYRVLIMYLDKPTIIDRDSTILYLREIDGKIKPFITNDLNHFAKNYYCKNIKIDEHLAQDYLNLFEKYDVLLKFFRILNNCHLFGDGNNSLFVNIDNCYGNLLEGLNKLYINIVCTYTNKEDFIKLVINLGENLEINYDNCQFVLNNQEKEQNITDYDYVLKNLYINKQYVRKRERES